MKTRTYEFFKVGYKAPNETEYTFYNAPYDVQRALIAAHEHCRTTGLKTCVARFQIIQTFEPDETPPTLAEKIADDIRNGTFGKADKS